MACAQVPKPSQAYQRALSLDPANCGIYNPPVLSLTSHSLKQNPLIRFIQHTGLGGLASAVLEHNAALASLLAQGVYLAEPLLDTWWPRSALHEVAHMLEHAQQRAALAQALRDPHP